MRQLGLLLGGATLRGEWRWPPPSRRHRLFCTRPPRLRSAIMRALSDDYVAPPPSPPSEDAVVVLGARLDEEPLSVEQEILMSLAIIELALGVLVVLGVLFACAYVAGFRKRRLPELAPARLALAWLAALWLLGLLLSRGCTWWLVDRVTYELAPSPDASPDRGPPPQAGEQAPLSDGHHDLMCTLHTCFTVGFVEPSLLLLVLGVVRSKTAAAPPPRWRVAAMLRRALLSAGRRLAPRDLGAAPRRDRQCREEHERVEQPPVVGAELRQLRVGEAVALLVFCAAGWARGAAVRGEADDAGGDAAEREREDGDEDHRPHPPAAALRLVAAAAAARQEERESVDGSRRRR